MSSRSILTGILLVFLLSASGGATEWHRSSSSGIPGQTMVTGPASDGWSLSIDRNGDLEIRSLFLDGEAQGSTYTYRVEGRLVAREERNADGDIVSRVEYAYDSHGNPRAVFIDVQDGSEGSRVVTRQEANPDGTVNRTTDGQGDNWLITDSDGNRNPLSEVNIESGSVVGETTWNLDDDGVLREEVRRNGPDTTRSLYDRQGRLVKDTLTRNGSVIRIRIYQWDDNRIVRVEEQGEGRTVVREMSWIYDRIESEVRSIDGVRVSESAWTSETSRVETLYRDGQPIIRIHWDGNSKVLEEFLKDGEVVRSRGDGR